MVTEHFKLKTEGVLDSLLVEKICLAARDFAAISGIPLSKQEDFCKAYINVDLDLAMSLENIESNYNAKVSDFVEKHFSQKVEKLVFKYGKLNCIELSNELSKLNFSFGEELSDFKRNMLVLKEKEIQDTIEYHLSYQLELPKYFIYPSRWDRIPPLVN